MNIPNSVTAIGFSVFKGCSSLTSVNIPNSVISIDNAAFEGCSSLTSVNIPNSVTSIGERAFERCSGLTTATIPNSVTSISGRTFKDCSSLTSVSIPNSVTSIDNAAFTGCSSLTSVNIPSSVTSIGYGAFADCSGLTSVTIPNSVTSIGDYAFSGCSGLTSVTIPNSVTSIGNYAFSGYDIPTVVSLIENPFNISTNVFSNNTLKNATLYVPVGTIDKYKATDGWKRFLFMEESTGGITPTTPQKCEKPTIAYKNGKLTFNCETEGATCQSSITDPDITSYSSKEVQLGVTYNISVYATKTGFENSETTTATLCWIDVEPKTEGITNGISNVPANAVLIQSANGVLNISGVNDGANVSVYTLSGQMVGASKAIDNQTSIITNLQKGEIVIVKIGEKSVKVIMQ